MAAFPVVLSSPSGGGKTTVCRGVLKKDRSLARVVTCTTRRPRLGERDGRDYVFWSAERFKKAVRRGEMAEWARVHEHYYGVPKAQFDKALKAGKTPVLVIDVQGGATIRRHYPAAVLIFLLPPSSAVLERRLRARRDNTDNIAYRLKIAGKEISRAWQYDYIVVNDEVGRAVSNVLSVIGAERLAARRQLKKLVKLGTGKYKFLGR